MAASLDGERRRLISDSSDDGSTASLLGRDELREVRCGGGRGREEDERQHVVPIEDGPDPCLLNGYAVLDDDGRGFCEGDSAADYVTISSYGGDYDFYGSSGAVVPGGQPVFTRRIFLFLLTTFLVRPACCAAFLVYGRFTRDYRLFETCLGVTLLFYAVLAVEVCLMYANIRADRMPFGRTERCLVAMMEITCPVVFVSAASTFIFTDPTFFDRVMRYPRSPEYGDVIDLLTGMAVVNYLFYTVISVSDALSFLLPRVWVVAITKSGIPF